MRLIDADALNFEKLQDTNGEAVPAKEYIAFLKGAMATEEMIKNAPTIDAEPVVYCKDCKHRNKEYGEEFCEVLGRLTNDKFYCSYGAKMDEV
ncbi:MAG: hypothetical protein K2F67_07600 [Eubacterium sp.]|nr:hypothetical protein [Eubacterium sp.]